MTSIALSQLASAAATLGVYVQGISNCVLTVAGATGKYNATITGYEFSGAYTGTMSTGASKTIGTVSGSGTLTFKARCVDSRGLKSDWVQCQQLFYAYIAPQCLDMTAYRSDDTGELDDTGTYISVLATATITSLGGANSATLTYAWRPRINNAYSTETSLTSGALTTFTTTNGFDPNIIYVVRVAIEDAMGYTWTGESVVSTELYPLHIRAGGKGVAIGQVCQTDDSFEINPDWEVYVKGVPIIDLIYPVGSIYLTTGSTSPAALFGGTWTQIEGKLLLAADDGTAYPAGGSGTVDSTGAATTIPYMTIYAWKRTA